MELLLDRVALTVKLLDEQSFTGKKLLAHLVRRYSFCFDVIEFFAVKSSIQVLDALGWVI